MGKFSPPAPSLPPPPPPVPDKETDAEVKAKKEEAARLARGRRGLGATINTSGAGAEGAATTQRSTLLGD
jgi:hypothetical protein